MSEDTKTLKATHEGEIEISGFKIRSYNLNNGERVLSRSDFMRALGRTGKAKGGRAYDEEFKVPVFLTAQNLKPFIGQGLMENSGAILFKDLNGMDSIGYKAELLPSVCYVFMDAAENDALKKTQEHIAARSKILVRGFATIGIIALIDEATGYQEVRDRQALQIILDKYIKDEWAKWTKTFPDEFYERLFKLKGLTYPTTSGHKPSFIGTWTNDIVYSRLAPGVLTELKRLTPRSESGNRPRKFFQHLSDDYGTPALRAHLQNVIFLMRGCTTWSDFYRKLNRAAPKYGDTLQLPLAGGDDEGDG
jgi:hypothetical protein